jgi:hypothetical protein
MNVVAHLPKQRFGLQVLKEVTLPWVPASKKGDPSDLIEACVLQRIWDEAWLNWSVQGEPYHECAIPYDGA